MNKPHCIVVSYKRNQWKKWAEKFNIENLSFEQFLKDNVRISKQLKIRRVIPVEVVIDFDAYLRWVKSNSLTVNNDHREEFAKKTFWDGLSGPGQWIDTR